MEAQEQKLNYDKLDREYNFWKSLFGNWEHNIKETSLDMEAPGVDFKLEYALEWPKKGSPFTSTTLAIGWPIACKITLGGIVLRERGPRFSYDRPIFEYQSMGHGWNPHSLHYIIEKIINDQECYFKLGDGKHVPLKFTPKENNKVEISLVKEYLNTEIAAFDYKKIRPVIVDKYKIINEFSSFLNCLFADIKKYGETELLKSLEQEIRNKDKKEVFKLKYKTSYYT